MIEVTVVIDLAVKNDPEAAVICKKRLIGLRAAYDSQARHAETKFSVNPGVLPVRPAPADSGKHGPEGVP